MLGRQKLRKLIKVASILVVFLIMSSFIVDKPAIVNISLKCRTHTNYNDISHVTAEVLDFLGSILGFYNEIPFRDFNYPSTVNVRRLVHDVYEGKSVEKYGVPEYAVHGQAKILPKRCQDTDLVIFIKSAVPNIESRNIIRETWGKARNNTLWQTFFLVGTKEKFQYSISHEAENYHDIFQTDFIDHYYNNTLKIIFGLQWIKSWCPEAKYFLMIDDDYIAFPNRILEFLKSADAYNQDNRLFMGYSISQRRPHRSKLSKWCISYEEYPYDLFPEFLTAGSILLSQQSLNDMTIAMPYIKPLFNDDVYYGIVSYKLGILPLHNKLMSLEKISPKDKLFKFILTSHGYHCVDDVLQAWRHYHNNG